MDIVERNNGQLTMETDMNNCRQKLTTDVGDKWTMDMEDRNGQLTLETNGQLTLDTEMDNGHWIQMDN